MVDKVMEAGVADVQQSLQFLHAAWKDSQSFHRQSFEIVMNLHHNEIQSLLITIVQIEQRQQSGLKISLRAVDEAMHKQHLHFDERLRQIEAKVAEQDAELSAMRAKLDAKLHSIGTPGSHQCHRGRDVHHEDARQARPASASQERLQACLKIANDVTRQVARSSSREKRKDATEQLRIAHRNLINEAQLSALEKRTAAEDPSMPAVLECSSVGEEVEQYHPGPPWLSRASTGFIPYIISGDEPASSRCE